MIVWVLYVYSVLGALSHKYKYKLLSL